MWIHHLEKAQRFSHHKEGVWCGLTLTHSFLLAPSPWEEQIPSPGQVWGTWPCPPSHFPWDWCLLQSSREFFPSWLGRNMGMDQPALGTARFLRRRNKFIPLPRMLRVRPAPGLHPGIFPPWKMVEWIAGWHCGITKLLGQVFPSTKTPQPHLKARNATLRQKLTLVMVPAGGSQSREGCWGGTSSAQEGCPHRGDPWQLLGEVPTEAIRATKVPHPSLGTGDTPREQLSTSSTRRTPPRPLITPGTEKKAFSSSLRAAGPFWGTHSSWVPSPAVTGLGPALLPVLFCSCREEQAGTHPTAAAQLLPGL